MWCDRFHFGKASEEDPDITASAFSGVWHLFWVFLTHVHSVDRLHRDSKSTTWTKICSSANWSWWIAAHYPCQMAFHLRTHQIRWQWRHPHTSTACFYRALLYIVHVWVPPVFSPSDRKQFVTRKTNSSCTHKHFLTTWTLRQNAKELEECDPVTLACRLPHGDRTLGCIGRGGQNSSGVWPCLWTVTRMTRPCSIFAQVMEVNACESSV